VTVTKTDAVETLFHLDSIGGESPYWDVETGQFWWLDIQSRLLNHGLESGEVESTPMKRYAGSFTLVSGSATVLASVDDGFAELGPGWANETVIEYETQHPTNAMNDGKCDPRGRMWAGSMSRTRGEVDGRLYCLDADGTVAVLAAGIEISNGIGWSPDGTVFYTVDSAAQVIYAYDCDLDAPTISNRRVLAEVPFEVGLPDGLAVDVDGYVWVAMCFGGVVNRYSPSGRLDTVVTLPVMAVTSVAFGGADLDLLHITTARLRDIPMTASHGLVAVEHQPGAGDVYGFRTTVPGLPMSRYVVNR
jgi:sugar lactone lactonase YvrE